MYPDRSLAWRYWVWSAARRARLRLIWVFEILLAVGALLSHHMAIRRANRLAAGRRPVPWAYLITGFIIGVTVQTMFQFPRASASGNERGVSDGAVWNHSALDGMNAPAGNAGEIAMALARMTPRELSLTYARIHSVFEAALTDGEFNTAGELLNYAALTERELLRRSIARPVQTASVAEMRMLLDVIR
jgi:hypothetical protein